jgi:hypothetical protein
MKLAIINDYVVTQIIEDPSEAVLEELSRTSQNIIDISERSDYPGVGWLLVNNDLVSNGINGTGYSKKITKLALRNRFTFTEKVTLQVALAQSAALQAWFEDFRVSTYVDLERTDTIQGIMYLEQAGLIGAGRASQIINNPIQDSEKYKGVQ